MKKFLIISLLLGCFVIPMTGCTATGSGNDWRNNVSQLSADIFILSKLATRVALAEAEMPPQDVALLEGYLVAVRDILAVPGEPNFDGARSLVGTMLPRKYTIYGMTIIDVLERYLRVVDLDITEDQEMVIALISSGIDGALAAVQEFDRQ